MIVFITFPFYWYKRKGISINKLKKDFGLYKRKYMFLYGFIGFCFVILAVFLISFTFMMFGIMDQEKVKEKIEELPLIAIPLAEELFFRGFLLKKLGIWASAAIFAILHFTYGSIVEIAAAFVIALVLSFLFLKTKSLYPSMIAHSFFNIISLSVMWFL